MAGIFWRVLSVASLLSLLLALGRGVGARQTPGAQLAYSHYDRSARLSATILVDTHQRTQVPIRYGRSSVKLIGWLDHMQMLVELDGRLARYDLKQGWMRQSVCPPVSCTLAIVSSDEPVGSWRGRTGQDLAPQWSPDRSQVALMRRIGNGFALLLYVTNSDGEARRITRRGVLGLNYFWRPCPEAGC